MVRIDTPDDTAWMYGVVAADQSAALVSYVQLDEPRNDQPAALRVPGLDPRRRYRLTDVTPGPRLPRRGGLTEAGVPGLEVSGAALAEIGLAIPPQRTLTAVMVHISALPLPGAPAQGGLGQHRGLEEGGLAGQAGRSLPTGWAAGAARAGPRRDREPGVSSHGVRAHATRRRRLRVSAGPLVAFGYPG